MPINGKSRGAAGDEALRVEGSADAPIVADRQETWTRAWAAKPAGPTIAARLPWVLVSEPELQDRLNALLTPETLIGRSQAQVEEDGWVDRVDFEVGFSGGGLLALQVNIEGSGAYPGFRARHVLLHVPEARVLGAEIFAEPEALAAHISAELRARAEAEDLDWIEVAEKSQFSVRDLGGYALSADGLRFFHDWRFPHAHKAHAPDGEVFVPWSALKLVAGCPLPP